MNVDYSLFPILAHSQQPLAPHDLWSAWQIVYPLTIVLLLSAWVYHRGALLVWRRAGRGHGIQSRQYLAFMSGLFAVAVALLTPLDALSDVLFSAHMVQHILLILVAAPLLAFGNAPYALMWALPRRAAQQISQWLLKSSIVKSNLQFLAHPTTAWTIFVIPFWLWHLPTFYQAALQNDFIHDLEHACFLLTAYFFWWVVLQHHSRMQFGINTVLLFMTMMQGAALGMLLVFSSRPWYGFYSDVSDRWGLAPLHDQQLAGLVMWLTGGIFYTLMSAIYIWKWLKTMDRAYSA
ncbi:MAG: cytochrome C oxidase assembly protein [Anaerolineaceae bacterium]|nr:cytochrome C oxidase assembly protein [Anaerolineaceae bacterium]